MPTISNREVIAKADMVVADLTANGGHLQPEQADKFLDMIYDEPTLLKQSRFVKMNAPEMVIPKIGFAERLLHAGTPEGVALAAADRAKATTSQITLTTKKMMGEVHISYDILEDAITKGQLENTIMKHMAIQASLDLEEAFLKGDTASSDPFLALQDGILKRATGHVQALTTPNNVLNHDVLTNAYKAMPAKYRRILRNMKFFMADNKYIDYRNFLSDRLTGLGDNMIQGTAPLYSNGVILEPAAMIPDDTVLFADPRNFLWGVQRDILIETDKDIRSQLYTIVISLRAAIQIEDTDAIVKVTGLA